jgi:hypothetical protein
VPPPPADVSGLLHVAETGVVIVSEISGTADSSPRKDSVLAHLTK